MTPRFQPAFLGFDCHGCGGFVPRDRFSAVCPDCGRPLVARYDLERVRDTVKRDALERFGHDLWRYSFVLPFEPDSVASRLGEGGTPLLRVPRLSARLGLPELWLKQEGTNPTQSFKARGLALAVAGAAAIGRRAIALPSAGNAGSAAAAYAAAAGMRCRITIPDDTPAIFLTEQRALGAEVKLVPGTISDAGRALGTWAPSPEWWNVATVREPFRLEGKKTLGYEIAEQLGWRLPDFIFYPTGGGTGLVGMGRAFAEMEQLGWIEGRTRFVSVQAAGCAPVVRAWTNGDARIAPWENAATDASGLRVPAPFADELILETLRSSGGTAVAVSEEEIRGAMSRLASECGLFASPEGAATLAALERLKRDGTVEARHRVVIFDTSCGLKYPEVWHRVLEEFPAGPTP
jgi:threonine synthase